MSAFGSGDMRADTGDVYKGSPDDVVPVAQERESSEDGEHPGFKLDVSQMLDKGPNDTSVCYIHFYLHFYRSLIRLEIIGLDIFLLCPRLLSHFLGDQLL